MPEKQTITELARRWNIPPNAITGRFWRGQFDSARCEIVAGHKLIPRDYAEFVIAPELRRAGYNIPREKGAANV